MSTPETPSPLEELASAGTAYKLAKERLKALRARRSVLVAQGFTNGIQATELAGHAGLSRQRLYLVRDLGIKELEASGEQLEISNEELLKSLMGVAAQLPSAQEATDKSLVEAERLLAIVAEAGGTPVKELARLAGVTPEQTRKVRLKAGVKPRRYASSA